MVDEPRADNSPDEGTQESPMPSEEQQTPDVQESEGQSQQSQEDLKLPDDAKERTKEQFDKLQSKLREEKSRREYLESVYQPLLNRQQEEQVPPVYDPSTGLLNEQALTDVQRRSIEAEKRAQRAEKSIQDYARVQEEREAFSAHPELDPENKKFDKTLHRQVRSVLTDAMLHPEDYGGKNLSFKEAADLVRSVPAKALDDAKQQGAKQAMENLTPKEQAALEATGSPGRRSGTGDIESLKVKTRKGDIEAVVERLNRMDRAKS